jgi:hypothetical protein
MDTFIFKYEYDDKVYTHYEPVRVCECGSKELIVEEDLQKHCRCFGCWEQRVVCTKCGLQSKHEEGINETITNWNKGILDNG